MHGGSEGQQGGEHMMSARRVRTDGAHHGRRQHEQRLDAAGHQAVGVDVHHPVIVDPGPQVDAPEILLQMGA